MNRIRQSAWSSAAALVLGVLVTTAAGATPRCETPNLPGERMACAKAKESPESLRRFIERTQAIYSLYFWDYMSEADLDKRAAQRQAQSETPRVAATAEIVASTK
jgi:hypothetical protein